MGAIINHNQRVKKYFIAWKNYDTILLRFIFSSSAKYIIRGKRVYNGIGEIEAYWLRNMKRQKDIKLHWKIINSSLYCDIVEFGAYFWDLETQLYTKINGRIIFKYDKNDKIKKLTEAYKKRTENIENL